MASFFMLFHDLKARFLKSSVKQVRLLSCVERTEVVDFVVESSFRSPSVFQPVDPSDAGCIPWLYRSILLVKQRGGFSQVFPFVVGWISVYVVHLIFRPRPRHYGECHSSSGKLHAADAKMDIASIADIVPHNVADLLDGKSSDAVSFTRENSGHRLVMNETANMFRSYLGSFHWHNLPVSDANVNWG